MESTSPLTQRGLARGTRNRVTTWLARPNQNYHGVLPQKRRVPSCPGKAGTVSRAGSRWRRMLRCLSMSVWYFLNFWVELQAAADPGQTSYLGGESHQPAVAGPIIVTWLSSVQSTFD